MKPEQIKFRGKQQSWIYGGVSIFENRATIYDYNCVAMSAYEVDVNSVGMFTGYTDKKDQEIYTNDYVKYHHRTSQFVVSFHALVVLKDGVFGLSWERNMMGDPEEMFKPLNKVDFRFLTVVGNTTDTPEPKHLN